MLSAVAEAQVCCRVSWVLRRRQGTRLVCHWQRIFTFISRSGSISARWQGILWRKLRANSLSHSEPRMMSWRHVGLFACLLTLASSTKSQMAFESAPERRVLWVVRGKGSICKDKGTINESPGTCEGNPDDLQVSSQHTSATLLCSNSAKNELWHDSRMIHCLARQQMSWKWPNRATTTWAEKVALNLKLDLLINRYTFIVVNRFQDAKWLVGRKRDKLPPTLCVECYRKVK